MTPRGDRGDAHRVLDGATTAARGSSTALQSPSPLTEIEYGVAGGTLVHFNVPLPWSKQAKKLRPAFEACRNAGMLNPR